MQNCWLYMRIACLKPWKMLSWRCGRLLVWDATCLDTLSPSHLLSATREAGAVAALAEWSKQEKYVALNQCHKFTLVAIKTAGPPGPETFSFLRVGCYLKQVTGEAKSFSYLRQRLSITVQLGNATAVMETMRGGGHHLPFDFFSWLPSLHWGALSASPLTACFSLHTLLICIAITIHLFFS